MPMYANRQGGEMPQTKPIEVVTASLDFKEEVDLTIVIKTKSFTVTIDPHTIH
jgi:hypothetical protein